MVLNIGEATGHALLMVVDMASERLLVMIPKTRSAMVRDEMIIALKHLGIVKHRLEYNLGFDDPFEGPAAWGYPRKEHPKV